MCRPETVTFIVFSMVLSLRCVVAVEPTRLDCDNLLTYRQPDGKVATVTTAHQWRQRRDEILRGMQQVMGTLPRQADKTELDVQTVEEVHTDKYVRRLITYRSERGSRTPAYLCIPKTVLAGKGNRPAVLCLHPTDAQNGHGVVVGTGGKPGRQYASELAERGFITLAPAYPLLANYWPNLPQLGYQSGTMKAIWDNIRGLDLLAEMPAVDSVRGFGVIGHSLGGHNAIFTAAFDDRISVLVTSCGFDSFSDYYDGAQRNWFFGKGWCQLRYMPLLSDYRDRLEEIPFDFSELLGSLAPRTVYINAPLHDSNFRAGSVDKCIAAARPVYELLGVPDQLIVRHPDYDHNFKEAQRREAYRLIDSVLCPARSHGR